MEKLKEMRRTFSNLRTFEQKEILSFLSLEDFIDNKFLMNKKIYKFFKTYFQKIILSYIKSKNTKFLFNENKYNTGKSSYERYYKKFLKKIFFQTEKDELDEDDNLEINKQNNFKIFIENYIVKRFIQFAVYKCDSGFFYNSNSYHYQNCLDYIQNWFCSTKNGKPFDLCATIYYDKTHIFAPIINQEIFKKIFTTKIFTHDNKIINEQGKEFEIKINLKDIKNLIDQSFERCYNFKDISSLDFYFNNFFFRKYDIKGWKDFKKSDIDNEAFNLSGVKKFMEPAIDDANFFEKIFKKNLNWNFFLSCFTINNNEYGYTCPVKTIAVYIHDEMVLNEDDLNLLKNEFFTENHLLNFIQYENKIFNENSQEIKEKFTILNSHKENNNDGFVSFYEFDTMKQRYLGKNLKLLMWITIPVKSEKYFELEKLVHFGRHIIVKLINANKNNDYDDNIDIRSLHFFGGVIHI